MRPHRRQPTRLPHPWDSPGKNTGVGCHFFLPCMKVKSESEVSQSCPTLSDLMDCSLPGSSIHGRRSTLPGKSAGVGCPLPSPVYWAAKLLSSFSRVQLCAIPETRLPFPRILQARTLEGVAISFSNECTGLVLIKSLFKVTN